MNAASNVIIDHCSTTWAVDENLSASGPRYDGPAATSHDVTIRHCLIAEGLDNSSHEKGPHSKGSLMHDCCRNIAVIANLYAHNADRNPYFKAETSGVIGNVLICGVSTRSSLPMISGTGEVYEEDNVAKGRDGQPVLLLDPQIRRLQEKPVWPSELQVRRSSEVIDYVVRMVGGYPSHGPTQRKLETIPEEVEARRQWLDRMEDAHR